MIATIQRSSLRSALSALLVIGAWLPMGATANEQRASYLLLELSGGGDEFIETDSGDELRAGELFQISYGHRFFSENLPHWQIDLRAGVRVAFSDLGGGDATFVRYPLSLVIHRLVGERWSLGGGMTYHLYPTYEFVTDTVDDRIDFDDAFGQFVHAEWRGGRFTLGLRYVRISYAREGARFLLPGGSVDDDIDGSAVGIYLAHSF